MPLPPVDSAKVPWPPRSIEGHHRAVKIAATWWAGDPAELSMLYSGDTSTGRSPESGFGNSRSSAWLRFWSRRGRDSGGATRTQLHIPLAADIAAVSADLLFGNAPVITFDSEAGAQERFDAIAQGSSLEASWLEAAETASALSGVYLRPTWDADDTDQPFITVVQPDAAVPTWRQGKLAEVTFYTTLPTDAPSTVWRHLEHHSLQSHGWQIEHALYAGSKDTLGTRQLSLDAHPQTAGLQDIIVTGVPWLGVSYVPNMRPNRHDRGSALGRGDFDGLQPMMDALDEAWSAWQAELRLAKHRIVVPESYLDGGPGQGKTFDWDRELFTPVASPAAPGLGDTITLTQFQIRSEQYAATCMALVERIVTSAGYAPQDFGLHIEGRADSGTALRIRRARSIATTAKKQRYWQPAVARSTATLLAIDRLILRNGAPLTRPSAVQVSWPEDLDVSEVAGAVDLIARANAASAATKVRMLHPDWDEAQVEDEVDTILQEQGMAVPDPGTSSLL